MASTYLSRTTVTPTNATKFTFSAWCKIANVSGRKCILGYNGGNHWYVIQFDNSADNCRFEWVEYNSGGTKVVEKYTSASLRDVNGYYHIVCKYNSTLSTVADRTKLYINGELADLATNNNPSHMLDAPSALGGHTQLFGAYETSSNNFDGIISHAHYCDGYDYDASSFGETDATTGEWKIKTSPSVTYGNNGFFILKDGNSVTDQSGNSNNFTVGGGTLTKTEDNPSNVFATMNPLNHDYANTDSQLLNGNTYVNPQVNGSHNYAVSTLGMPKGNGKFYAEAKLVQYDNSHMAVGIVDMDYVSELFYQNRNIVSEGDVTYLGRVVYTRYGYVITGGGTETQGFGATYTNGDILQIACDMENGAIYFGKNGTWQNSGDPTSGASRTGAVNTSTASWWTGTSNWGFWCGDKSTTGLDKFAWNFGNGYFQTTAVSSAGTNASGNGIFEYDVPTGFTALSTKGLNL